MRTGRGWWHRLAVPLLASATGLAMAGFAAPSAAVAHSSTVKTVPVQQLSNRVLKLIKAVEGSDLACPTRNDVVRRLRHLDDALLSGRRSAARALALAWLQNAWSLQSGRVLSPEVGSAVQTDLGGMQGQIGIGWPTKPQPTRHWKPLPSCDTGAGSSAGVVGASYTPTGAVDLASDIEIFLQMIVGSVPVIGALLQGAVTLLWPAGSTADNNAFQELVDQDTYNRVKTQLQGFMDLMVSPTFGWNTQFSNWQQDCVDPDKLAQDPNICANEAVRTLWIQWSAIFTTFNADAAIFQQAGYQVNLLPLYAQYETLYLSFLRDGMNLHDQYWSEVSGVDPNDLAGTQMAWDLNPAHAERGIGYVNATYQEGLSHQPSASKDWQARNSYIRNETLLVLDFKDTWKYLDPRAYPDGVPGGVKLTRMIYSGKIGTMQATPSLPHNVPGPLTEVSVWPVTVGGVGLYGSNKAIASVQSTSPPLLGPAQSGAVLGDGTPPVNGANYYNLRARGPIIQVYGNSNKPNSVGHLYPAYLAFSWARGGASGNGERSSLDLAYFNYPGEVLATAQVISSYQFPGWPKTADSVVFGFRYANSFTPAGEVIGAASGKCIRLATWANTTQAEIYTCNTPPAHDQIWTYDPALQQISVTNPDEYSESNPTDSGKHCLDTAGGGTAAGTAVMINACDDGARTYDTTTRTWVKSSQRWAVDAVGPGMAKITNVKSGLVIDVAGHSTGNGAGLVLEPYTGNASQQWHAHSPLTGEIHGIGSGHCVDVPDGATTAGIQVQLYACNGTAAQQWTYNPTSKALIYLKNPSLCLEVRNGGGSGSAVQINTCNGWPRQQWRLNGDGSTIVNSESGLVMDAVSGGTSSGTLVRIYGSNGTEAQQWSRTSSQGGALYSVGAAKCLALSTNGTQAVISSCASPPNAGQTWTYHAIAQTFTAESPSGQKCLDAAGTAVVINDCTGLAGQRWSLNFGNKTVTNVNSGLVLDTGGGTTDGTLVRLSQLSLDTQGTPVPTSGQKWVWSLS